MKLLVYYPNKCLNQEYISEIFLFISQKKSIVREINGPYMGLIVKL